MRKIKSKEDIEKRQNIKAWVVGGVLIALMVLSPLGFSLFNRGGGGNNPDKIEYQGFEFVRNQNGYWKVEIDGETFTTRYNPLETENISMDFIFSRSYFYNKPLYYVYGNENAMNEFLYNLGRFSERAQEVCLENKKCRGEFVIKNCSSNVIVFNENNVSESIKIYKEQNCVFINAEDKEQSRAVDRIIFKVLEIQN